MAKTKAKTRATSPVATRTRSKQNNTINDKKKVRLMECHVRLHRLTEVQIMRAVANDLTEIKNNRAEKKYNLRSGNNRKEAKVSKPNKKTISTALVGISPSDMTVARLWTFLKKEFSVQPFKGLCCLAKMRTYSPWPSVVTETVGDRVKVYFFGDGTTGTVQKKEVVPFDKCVVLIKKYLGVDGYSRAVRELEISINIPHSSSITM